MSLLPPEDDALAGELALRLLDDAELAQARARETADPAFAAAVADWDARLMPWLDAIAPVTPDPNLWERIASVLAQGRAALADPVPDGNVVALRRKVRNWRAATAGLTALAASLALFVGFRELTDTPRTRIVTRTVPVPTPVPVPVPTPVPAPAPVPAPTPPPAASRELMVAALTPDDAPTMAVVSYDRVGQSLIVTPATLARVPGRSHELWVVPATGNPRSLGLVTPGAARRIAIADDLERLFAGEATVAISTEREGGSRSGLPAGPIVATGTLRAI